MGPIMKTVPVGDRNPDEWNYLKQDARGGEPVEHGGKYGEEGPDAKEH